MPARSGCLSSRPNRWKDRSGQAAKIKEAASEDAQREAEGIQIVSISARLNGLQKRQKKLAEKCWQKAGGVVLYLSAKRWDKEWLLKPQHEAFEKNQ